MLDCSVDVVLWVGYLLLGGYRRLFIFLDHPADLREGVTDDGLRALASAGCGEKLTELTLWSE